ncbi:HD domain-containing protein [Saccharothrix sp. AJ9571]|nr:HD domain-containing protein [Saccharothrix sp. AJ9571]
MRVFGSWRDWPSAAGALGEVLPEETIEKLAHAYEFAARHHGDQTRPAGEPYPWHLLEALEIAVDSGARDEDVLVAALLHDVVEDTPCSLAAVRAEFGAQVAELVDWVTKAGSRESYLSRFVTAPEEVLTIKLADRYSNVQRLHTHPRPAKRATYYAETVRVFLPLADRLPYFRDRFAEWQENYAYLAS